MASEMIEREDEILTSREAQEFLKIGRTKLWELTKSNQLPAYRGAGKGISCYQCCAYQFSAVADKDSDFDRKLLFEDGRHFSMGSWQVVSVNCPRAAYNS